MKQKIYALYFFLLFLSVPAVASHLVGGYITLKWVSGNDYEITYKVYRDCANGLADFDNPSYVSVYDKNSNTLQSLLGIYMTSRTILTLGDACFTPGVCVEEATYIQTVTLPSFPGGAYLVSERCCRNGIITNLYDPGNTGMAFYAEIPDPDPYQWTKDNSTPQFGAYPKAYMCANQPNYLNFGTTDLDGDSLVYSLETPLAGYSSPYNIIPYPPSAGPHPGITWQSGYGLGNIVGGSPAMSINPQTGLVTAYPSNFGVFVFCVQVKEYRNGQYLGLVRFDVQYSVINCPQAPFAVANTCVGSPATVTYTGSQPSYATYNWNLDGGTIVSGSGQGPLQVVWYTSGVKNITLTVVDGACTYGPNQVNITVSQPNAGAGSNTSICYGNSTILNGSGGGNYAWSPAGSLNNAGISNPTATPLTPTTYTLTVTDGFGCTKSATTFVDVSPATVQVTAYTNVNCYGQFTGSATAVASGNSSVYNYSWSAIGGYSATTASIANIGANTYTITVTDGIGCTNTSTIQITQPSAPLSSSIISSTPVTCFGTSTGIATASTSGGSTGYTYNWSPSGGSGLTASNLAAATYTFTVTDAKNCTSTKTISITQPAAGLSSSIISSTNINCFGTASGSAIASASGGSTNYSYSWSSGHITNSPTGLLAGTYTVIVTDAKNCTSTSTIQITQPIAALSANIISSTNINCFGNSNGNATATASGGSTNYIYSWSNGQLIATATGLTANTYTITVTDAKNCTSSSTIQITQPVSPLAASIISSTNVNCFGNNTGNALASASGGTTNYSYSWSNGQLLNNVTGLAASTYTVTVTDGNSCTQTASIQITQPASGLSASAAAISNVDCFGNSTGSASASATGGSGILNYSWSNGTLTSGISNIIAGIYTVTITDGNSCTNTSTVSILQPSSALSVSINSLTNVLCNSNGSGAASAAVSGGTSAYSYSWSNGSSSTGISGLTAGGYTVTVTDNNGCTSGSVANITEPPILTSSTTATTPANCGLPDGTATISASGGFGALTYTWAPSGGNTNSATGLAAGGYTVTINDANSCSTTQAVAINNLNGPTGSVSSSIAVNCFGQATGSGTVSGTGGSTPYTYSWSSGSTDDTASNLPAGSYNVTITDQGNCKAVVTVDIIQPAAPLNTAVYPLTNVLCYGALTGSATVTVSGGTSAYTYSWDGPLGSAGTNNFISNAGAGTYTFTVTDANSCTHTTQVSIQEPASALNATIASSTNIACVGNSGSASATANGGMSPYTYSWSNGALSANNNSIAAGVYTVTVTDNNNCSATTTVSIIQPPSALDGNLNIVQAINCNGGTAQVNAAMTGGTTNYTYSWSNNETTQTASNLTAGSYTVVVTDNNGCIKSLNISINQPQVLIASIDTTGSLNCFGGAVLATANITGGSSGYTYSWTGGTTSNNLTITNSGTYVVTVTDNNSCTYSQSIVLTAPTSAVSINISSINNITCKGSSNGNVTVNPSGGSGSYSYTWSNSSSNPSVSNLSPATYTVVVNDTKNCSASVTVTITEPAQALSSNTLINIPVKCFGEQSGGASVSGTGGTSPYSYSWSNNDIDSVISNIASGTYTVTIEDANNCTVSSVLLITQPSTALSANIISVQNMKCFGDKNGSANVTGLGGTSPYSYLWNNGDPDSVLTNVVVGDYTITVTDANNCSATKTTSIKQPSAILDIVLTSTGIACKGGTGEIYSFASGGTSGYTYSWSTGSTQTSISNLSQGSYTITVTDTNSCKSSASYTLTEPSSSFSAIISSQADVKCYAQATGSSSISASGGTSPYSFSWNMGTTTATATGLQQGYYTVTITDANGCTGTVSVNIKQPASALALTPGASDVVCKGDQTGIATVTPAGGTSGYTYSWSDGSTAQEINNLAIGVYTVLVTDANNCTSSVSVSVSQTSQKPFQASFTTDITSGPAPLNVTFLNTSTGALGYTWNFGDSSATSSNINATHNYNTPGSYTVTLIAVNENGCRDTADITIHPFIIPNFFSPNEDSKNDVFFINCAGMQDVSVEIYDRWGLKIYEWHGINAGWDGRTFSGELAPDGTYYYMVWLTAPDKKQFEFQGYLQLLR